MNHLRAKNSCRPSREIPAQSIWECLASSKKADVAWLRKLQISNHTKTRRNKFPEKAFGQTLHIQSVNSLNAPRPKKTTRQKHFNSNQMKHEKQIKVSPLGRATHSQVLLSPYEIYIYPDIQNPIPDPDTDTDSNTHTHLHPCK